MVSWTFESARSGFERHAGAWDALNREHGSHILLDSRFVGPLVRHFATPATLLGVSTNPGARGIALLERGRLGFASTFQPSQSPLGLILLESREQAIPMTRDLIRRLPGYALAVSVLHQDPDFTLFPELGPDPTAERMDYMDTGRLRIEGGFEQYMQGLGKNLPHNLRRQRRRLAEAGKSLELRIVTDPGQAADCVATYGRLEGSGWKATTGTAVAADNAQGMFYREVLETFMPRNEGAVFQLELDGRVIASDLSLERDGMMVLLKTAYDASIDGLSPGLLLHQEIFRHCFEAGRVRQVEFYGRVLDWHTKWTSDFRRMYHVNFYRDRWAAAARAMARRGLDLLRRQPKDRKDPAAGQAPTA